MKKIILVLIFIWAAGILPAHAFEMEDQGGFYSVGPYPYPPVISEPLDNLPQGFDTIILGRETFYYFNGVFYQKIVRDAKYAIVPPPIGAVVYSLPTGYGYMLINGKALYVSGGVYYKQVLDGYKVIYPPAGV